VAHLGDIDKRLGGLAITWIDRVINALSETRLLGKTPYLDRYKQRDAVTIVSFELCDSAKGEEGAVRRERSAGSGTPPKEEKTVGCRLRT